MATASDTVEIKNVGAVEYVRFDLPVGRGGVKILTGTSGSGKTTALAALNGLLGIPGESAGLAPSDGSDSGEIQGLGRSVKVSKRSRATGELDRPTLGGKLDIAKLVDPGLKDKEARTKLRIRVLVAASGAQLAPRDLLGDQAELIQYIDIDAAKRADDAVQMADLMKRQLDAAALDQEKEAGVLRKLSDAKAFEAGDVDELKESSTWEQVAAEHRDAMQRVAAIDAGLKAQQDAEIDNKAAAEEIKLLTERAKSLTSVDEIEHNISQQEKLIEGMERRLADAKVRLEQLRGNLREVQSIQRSIEAANARIKTVATSYTEKDLVAAVADRDAKYSKLERVKEIERRKDALAQADKHRLEAEGIETLAQKLRNAAQVVQQRLQRILPAGPIEIDGNGDLVVQHAKRRKKVSYDELSDGERWAIAMQYIIQLVGKGGVVALTQEAWQALAPELKQKIRQLCEEFQVWIISAEVADGPLRVADYN